MKRIIVMGGSAGGIQALCTVLKSLPQQFPAPILAVIHIPEESNHLTHVFQRCSRLKLVDVEKAQPIQAGNVYIAPANRHLVVKSGCAVAVMGPRENRHRPAIDTLFRSASRAYRSSVIAVVLSGALDDGSAGALAVKSRGGTIVVQRPESAEIPEMPANVIRQVKTDYRLNLNEIAPLLKRLVKTGGRDLPESAGDECEEDEGPESLGGINEPFAFSCPECGGAMLSEKNHRTTQMRCHVGHRFSLDTFTEAHADAVERAVWVALRKLKERQMLNEQLAREQAGSTGLKKRFKENAAAAAHDIQMLEEVLTRL